MSAPNVTIRMCLEAVALQFDVSRDQLVSHERSGEIDEPRHAAIWLAHALTGKSIPEIGRRLGGRDRASILRAIRRAEHLRNADDKYRETLDLLSSCVAAAAQAVTTPGTDEPDVMEVAIRILTRGRRAMVTTDEQAALATFAVQQGLQLGWLQIGDGDAADPDDEGTEIASGASAVGGLVSPVATVLAAHQRLEQALYSPGERSAREAFETALKTLKTTFEERT